MWGWATCWATPSSLTWAGWPRWPGFRPRCPLSIPTASAVPAWKPCTGSPSQSWSASSTAASPWAPSAWRAPSPATRAPSPGSPSPRPWSSTRRSGTCRRTTTTISQCHFQTLSWTRPLRCPCCKRPRTWPKSMGCPAPTWMNTPCPATKRPSMPMQRDGSGMRSCPWKWNSRCSTTRANGCPTNGARPSPSTRTSASGPGPTSRP